MKNNKYSGKNNCSEFQQVTNELLYLKLSSSNMPNNKSIIKKSVVFSFFASILITTVKLSAATITSTGTGGAWNTGSTWVGGAAPASTDSVVIASGATVTLGGSRACSSVTILGTLTMVSPNTLTLSGNFTNNGTFNGGATNAAVIFNGNNDLQRIAGSVATTFNKITVNKGTSVNNILNVSSIISMASNGLTLTNGTFKISSASTITPFTGNVTIGSNSGIWNNGGTVSIANGGVMTLNGLLRNSAGTTTIGSAIGENLAFVTGSNIIIDGGNVNIAGAFVPVTPGTDAITYNQSAGIFTCGILGIISLSTGMFDIRTTGSSFTMSGGTIVVVRDNLFYSGADIQLLASTYAVTGGTVQIGNAVTPASRTILINSTVPFYNLTINTTNSPVGRLVTNGLAVLNNLSIASGATLNLNNLNLAVGGNWTNSGTFTSGTGNVTFIGSNPQSITGATLFYSLTINKSDKAISLNNDMTITNTISFIAGVVKGMSSLLIINDNAIAINMSDASHFKGAVRKIGNDAFTFPTGDSVYYAPIGISSPTNVTQIFTANYFHTSYINTDSIIGMNNVSIEEFWILDRTVNTDSVNVTLSYSTDRNSYVNTADLSDLKVSRWNGTKWVSQGNGGTTFTSPNGTIVTDYKVTNFSPFTLGSTLGLNPLPVDWLNFNASIVSENQVNLKWTINESENIEFNINKSIDGKRWVHIGKINGHSSVSSSGSYFFSDMNPLKGKQYYQIEELSLNGRQSFSSIIPVMVKGALNTEVIISPNPFNNYLNILLPTNEPTSIMVYNITGKKVFETNSYSGQNLTLDFSGFDNGIYWAETLCNGIIMSREKLLKF